MKRRSVILAALLGLTLRGAGGDAPTISSDNETGAATKQLVLNGTNCVVDASCDYLVIDISGATSTSHYPASYLPAIPVGGWTDEYKTTKIVLRRIPATTTGFMMGSPADESGRCPDEVQHAVTLTRAFFIGVFPVTQRQWELVMGTRPSYFNNATYYCCRPVEQVSYDDIRGPYRGSQWPVTNAVDRGSFMGMMRKRTGLAAFDLPTEAQWEYACRAGTTTALNTGHNLTSDDSDLHLDSVARYWSNSRLLLRQGCAPSAGTAIVGSYLPNAWGLYDMHGNVWEWCRDWYGPYTGAATDPSGASAGAFRVLRGGSWSYGASFCRSAYRYYYGSRSSATDTQCYNFGFRAALTLP